MRPFTRGLRTAARSLSATTQSTINGERTHSGLFRQTLLIGGLGLSMLAIAHAESCSVNGATGDAQCDARFTPAYSGEDVGDAIGFTLPLDGEAYEAVAHAKSRVARFSCASYKANFPIEDKFDVQTMPNGDVYALVLDGHGGWQVSEYGKQVLIDNVKQEVQHLTTSKASAKKLQDISEKAAEPQKAPFKHAIASAIQRGFARTDRDLLAKVTAAFQLGFGAVGRCGSCALMVVVRDNMLHVANAGDIRAVLGKQSKSSTNAKDPFVAVALTQDQNAMSKIEQDKLTREHPGEENAFVCRRPDSCYVKGALQPTRALGDFALKYSEFNGPPYVNGDRSAGRHIAAPYSPPYITATPDVRSHEITAEDQFVIIGSDGVWDFLTNDEAVEVVRAQIANGTPQNAGRALVEKTLQTAAARYAMTYAELLSLPPGSHRRRRHDDTTVVVVFFQ